MQQNMQHLNRFYIIGIAIETTNANGQAAQDLGQLWEQFFAQQISTQLPTKLSDDIYAIYTDYESDYTGKYTAIIGHKVTALTDIPKGMVRKVIPSGNYQSFLAKGAMPAAVGATWQQIWAQDEVLNRAYQADFEVYGAKSQQGDESEVAIYIGL